MLSTIIYYRCYLETGWVLKHCSLHFSDRCSFIYSKSNYSSQSNVSTKCITFPPLYSAQYPPILPYHYTEYKIDITSYLFNHLKNNKWIAIIAQLAPTYGLSRSPIRLIFQKNPDIPDRFNLVSPGCNVYNTEDNGRHRWEINNNIKLSSQQQL